MTSPRPRAWEVAAFAAAFAVAACVGLALLWASEPPHRAVLAREPRGVLFTSTTDPSERTAVSIDEAAALHVGWAGYVTGRSADQPARDRPWFTDDERTHMADVRAVFVAAQGLALVAVAALGILAWRARSRGSLAALARAGAIAAAGGVTALGLAAAVSFDAVFLLFHRIVFPQGNFLFPPGSNLLRLYPEAYWYALTIGIAVSLLALAAAVATLGHIALRASTARSAIVSPR